LKSQLIIYIKFGDNPRNDHQ